MYSESRDSHNSLIEVDTKKHLFIYVGCYINLFYYYHHHQYVSYLHKDVDCYSVHNLDQTTLSFANRNSSIGGLFVNLPT